MALDMIVISEETNPIVQLTGKIVDADVKKLQQKLDTIYRNKQLARIVVDVTAVDFIDSHGLGVIVYFHTLMQKEKRKLVILNANPDQESYLNRLFEVTNLDKVLNIVCMLEPV
jgi:anti-anti-sigma factor